MIVFYIIYTLYIMHKHTFICINISIFISIYIYMSQKLHKMKQFKQKLLIYFKGVV